MFIAGGEAIISTQGYIVRGRGTDHQTCDIWCIIFESLIIFVQGHFVLVDYALLTGADRQYRGCHFWILLYPCSFFGTSFHIVQQQSTKKATCLPVEHIAHFGFAKMPFCLALCCVQ